MGRLLLLASSFLWSFALLNCSSEQKKLGVTRGIKKTWGGVFCPLFKIGLEKKLKFKLKSKDKTEIVNLFHNMKKAGEIRSFLDLTNLIINYIEDHFPESKFESIDVARVLYNWNNKDRLGLTEDAVFLDLVKVVDVEPRIVELSNIVEATDIESHIAKLRRNLGDIESWSSFLDSKED